ncbi:MAG: hypothetical protein LBQ31_07560 [Bacteroidales bacterium]|nr:hypothetical protein [Bacteroidales bacterium]
MRDYSGNPFADRGLRSVGGVGCADGFKAGCLFYGRAGKRLLLRNEVAHARHSPRKRGLCGGLR